MYGHKVILAVAVVVQAAEGACQVGQIPSSLSEMEIDQLNCLSWLVLRSPSGSLFLNDIAQQVKEGETLDLLQLQSIRQKDSRVELAFRSADRAADHRVTISKAILVQDPNAVDAFLCREIDDGGPRPDVGSLDVKTIVYPMSTEAVYVWGRGRADGSHFLFQIGPEMTDVLARMNWRSDPRSLKIDAVNIGEAGN